MTYLVRVEPYSGWHTVDALNYVEAAEKALRLHDEEHSANLFGVSVGFIRHLVVRREDGEGEEQRVRAWSHLNYHGELE